MSRAIRLYCADCLEALELLPDRCADLVYMDPPFNTRRSQIGEAGRFRDSWSGPDEYLRFLRPRVERAIAMLNDEGSILIHCDWRTNHHIRLLLDELLGADAFVNHLIWRYGLGGSSPRRFARKHDDILFYARSDAYYFDPPMVPATSARMRGELKKATDVLDIPAINNMARERTGYPTQKPLELLELLIRACCPENGLVVDPFCGSGTTLVAAARTDRRGIGIDCSAEALALTEARLAEIPDLKVEVKEIACAEAPM